MLLKKVRVLALRSACTTYKDVAFTIQPCLHTILYMHISNICIHFNWEIIIIYINKCMAFFQSLYSYFMVMKRALHKNTDTLHSSSTFQPPHHILYLILSRPAWHCESPFISKIYYFNIVLLYFLTLLIAYILTKSVYTA